MVGLFLDISYVNLTSNLIKVTSFSSNTKFDVRQIEISIEKREEKKTAKNGEEPQRRREKPRRENQKQKNQVREREKKLDHQAYSFQFINVYFNYN